MPPNVREAKQVQDSISAIVQDVKLFYDHGKARWAVCQLTENAGGIILPIRDGMSSSRPTVMFFVQNRNGEYRIPGQQDISDVVALRRNADVAFQKGGDWVADQMESREADKDAKFKQSQTAMIADFAKPLKEAIKKELT